MDIVVYVFVTLNYEHFFVKVYIKSYWCWRCRTVQHMHCNISVL